MIELKPCQCNADINDTLKVQVLWIGTDSTIGVVYCNNCKNCAPFKAPTYTFQYTNELLDIAYQAWNNEN